MASDVAVHALSPPPYRARAWMAAALVIIPVNFGVMALSFLALDYAWAMMTCWVAFGALALAQLVCGIAAVVAGLRERRATQGARGLWPAILGAVATIAVPVGCWLALAAVAAVGSAMAP